MRGVKIILICGKRPERSLERKTDPINKDFLHNFLGKGNAMENATLHERNKDEKYKKTLTVNQVCAEKIKSKRRVFESFVRFCSQWFSFKSAEIRLTGGN